jgi:hypothetical protein
VVLYSVVVIRCRRFGTPIGGVISQKSADHNGMSYVKPVHGDTPGMSAIFSFVFSVLYGGNIRYLYGVTLGIYMG